jgi:hypothetical protein
VFAAGGPFWHWYQWLSEAQRSNSTGPLLNKLRVFLLRKTVRAIVGANTSTLDVEGVINGGRVLLARLSKGVLGEDTSRLLGSMVVARTWHAALARAALKPEQRRDASLAIAASAKLRHHIEVNEFFSRLASEAAAQGGALTEWYGERTTQWLFQGRVTPDGYGVLNLAGREPLHILLELDRATEPVERLHGKATRYAQELPRSVLSDASPAIIMAVPTSARAQSASAAIATAAAPITVAVWDEHRSTLEIVTSAPPARLA